MCWAAAPISFSGRPCIQPCKALLVCSWPAACLTEGKMGSRWMEVVAVVQGPGRPAKRLSFGV